MSPFGRPVCSVTVWGPHSVVFASGVDSGCVPLTTEGVGLVPSSSGPVASRSPLGIGLLQRPRGDAFHLGVSMRWSSTHGGLPGLGCWCPFRVPQILCLVPLRGCSRISGFWYSGTGVAPGIIPSSWHGFLSGAWSVFVRWGSSGHPTYVFFFLNALFILASASTRCFWIFHARFSVALLPGAGVGCPLLSSRP